MNGLDNVVFGKKKFSDILEEIYTNQQKKDKQISILISELKPLVQEIGDATLIVPIPFHSPNFLNKSSSELSNIIFLTLTEIIDELPLDGEGDEFVLWVLPEV